MATDDGNTTRRKGSLDLLTTETGDIPEYLINGVVISEGNVTTSDVLTENFVVIGNGLEDVGIASTDDASGIFTDANRQNLSIRALTNDSVSFGLQDSFGNTNFLIEYEDSTSTSILNSDAPFDLITTSGDMTLEVNTGLLKNIVGTAATSAIASYQNIGTNGATYRQFLSDTTPVGNITGNPGDKCMFISGSSSTEFIHKGSSSDNTSWFSEVTSLGALTDNFVVRGNGEDGVDVGNITMSADGNDLFIPGEMTFGTSGTQSYTLGDDNFFATLQGNGAGRESVLKIFANDGDGTDSVGFIAYGVGTPGSEVNSENLFVGWDASLGSFDICSLAIGTGTLRPITITTDGNTNQIKVQTDGSVDINREISASADGQTFLIQALNNDTIAYQLRNSSAAVVLSASFDDSADTASLTTAHPLSINSTGGDPLRVTGTYTDDTEPLVTHDNSGATNGISVDDFFSTNSPQGVLAGSPGNVVRRKDGIDSSIYVFTGTSGTDEWVNLRKNSMINFGAADTAVITSTSRYLNIDAPTGTATTTRFNKVIDRGGIMRSMSVRQDTPGVGTEILYQLLVNGTGSTLSLTMAPGDFEANVLATNPVIIDPQDHVALLVRGTGVTTAPQNVNVQIVFT